MTTRCGLSRRQASGVRGRRERRSGYLGVDGVSGVAQKGHPGAMVGAGLRDGQGEGHAGARHVRHLHADGLQRMRLQRMRR